MRTLDHVPGGYDSREISDTDVILAEVVPREGLRIPYLLAGVALAESHVFNPVNSEINPDVTLTGVKIDDGLGSMD